MHSLTKLIRRFSFVDYYPVTLAFFLIGWGIDRQSGTHFFATVPGLLLLAYLPGYHLVRLTRLPISHWHWYGRLALYFTTSISIIAVCQFVGKTTVPFSPLSQTALLILINTLLYGLAKLYAKPGNTVPGVIGRIEQLAQKSTWVDYLVLLAPVIIYGLTLVINPTVDNADGYLELLQNAVDKQEYPFAQPRILFLPLLAIYHYITQLSPIVIFKLLLTLSFYSSLFLAFDYIKRTIKDRWLGNMVYLALLAPPVILIEANIVRPQLLVMAFTFPILFLLIEAVKSHNYRFAGFALWFSTIVTGFHELGGIFILTTCLTLLPMLYRSIFIRKEIRLTAQQVILAIVIAYPYVKMFHILSFLDPIIRMIRYAASFLKEIKWEWWFIDSYTTIDGFNVGWPGIQALHYYLYNGLLLILAVLALSLLIWRQGRSSRRDRQHSWLIILPLLYVIFYFTFAELLPRIGLFFIPNRAWPHLMLGLIVCLILLVERNQQLLANYRRFIQPILTLIILPGIAATLYLTYNRVGTVFPEEIPAARYIQQNLPMDSIVISTQPNFDLVRFYGKRQFITTIPENFPRPITDRESFEEASREFIRIMTTTPPPYQVPEQSLITQRYSGTTLIEESRQVLSEAQFVRPRSQIPAGTPFYFIYSFKKLGGMNGARIYNKRFLDEGSRAFFEQLTNQEYVYRDDAIVIVRMPVN